ncbi:MAG TPA: alpha/beta hydrolase [Acidimicrobiales bacterium]|nr:alpha/beta hydrolase [Acidimicrobiales bacterium]
MHGVRRVSLGGGSGGDYVVVHDLGGAAGGAIGAKGTARPHEKHDLLLVHATGLHGRVWAPLVAHLAPRLQAGALAVDVRGHGESAPLPEGGLAWEDLAADLLAVVDQLDLRRPLGLGHSSGASLLLLAEELAPGTFEALYCVEPIGTAADEPPPPNRAHPLAEGARRRRRRFSSRQEAFDTYAAKPPFSQVTAEALWAYVDHGFADDAGEDGNGEGAGVRLRCLPEAEADMYANGLSHHAYRDLGRVRCPVVLACGNRSAAVTSETLTGWAARMENARVEILPGLGHFAPLQDPPAVARSVTAALP